MKNNLLIDILPQPDDTTCGPTCLHAVYRYFGDIMPLGQVVSEVTSLASGGTLAVFLACHALRRGYSATIFTYNLHFYDPTWFHPPGQDLREKLVAQAAFKKDDARLQVATKAYLDFLDLGGRIFFEDMTRSLVRWYLRRSVPIITGLSSTYLYQSMREYGINGDEDDVRGEPAGHFVVLSGYDKEARTVYVNDPYHLNPVAGEQSYAVNIDRVLCAILLGVLTHDANFLIIQPGKANGQVHRMKK
ncbi:MAG: C39 family peptidase [Deltaproteobacteria bacterium]|nr:C39 family peptidase [Deltaproteobacteria bacterium]